MDLIHKKCKPCEGGIPKLNSSEVKYYNSQLNPSWIVIDDLKIVCDFSFKSYFETIGFVDKIAEIAESEGHHPVMHVFFSKVQIELWTHAILGLSENDFILAAKINERYLSQKS